MSLRVRQKKFIQEYMATGNATQSAIKVGYSRASARSTTCEILTNPNISQMVSQEMYKHGITLELLINVLKEGLNAKKSALCAKNVLLMIGMSGISFSVVSLRLWDWYTHD